MYCDLISLIIQSEIYLMQYTIFFISDGTGITAETLGQTLLSQFQALTFEQITIPFVNRAEKAQEVVLRINKLAEKSNLRPVIFSTIVNEEIKTIVASTNAVYIDFFQAFIPNLEKAFNEKAGEFVGYSHGIKNQQRYTNRIEALNYTLNADDGLALKTYEMADLILVGVSRTGKTPTSLYLAIQFGLYVANYPITEDDFPLARVPSALQKFQKKLFGLTIQPLRLSEIRNERRAGSQYASIAQCKKEINAVEKMFHRENIPFLETTHYSIEEISARILTKTGLSRRS